MLKDPVGIVCATFGTAIVVIVAVAHVRVGLWEYLWAGEPMALLLLSVFSYHCLLIFMSHYRCMVTEPGYIPKNCEELDTSKMSPELVTTLYAIKCEVKR